MEKSTRLADILNSSHSLYRLANSLNWEYLSNQFGKYYAYDKGRPAIPIRVMVGLHYLKYLEDESDESVVEKFVENPYWQYFCGYETFQHEPPCHPTTLVKWRNKVGHKGVEKLLIETIRTAKRTSLLPEKLLSQINVDTTVQEKAITYPTDAKLYLKICDHLVLAAKERDIKLRQSYKFVSKTLLVKYFRYRHANQYKRANKALKKLHTYVGRLYRDILRKADSIDNELQNLLDLSEKILSQKKKDKNKIYSLHAPEVECISKGKAHKKYEFGCKVSIATTSQDPWVVGISACHGNPYDGATLIEAINNVEEITGTRPANSFVDKGYRGKDHHPEDVTVYISGRKNLSPKFKKLLKGRQAIEPIIGHLKSDHRMQRNYLLGKTGDKINALLAGCAFNLQKILRLFSLQSDHGFAY